MSERKVETRRYTLVLPADLGDDVEQLAIADRRSLTGQIEVLVREAIVARLLIASKLKK